jgi:hypothetical protein
MVFLPLFAVALAASGGAHQDSAARVRYVIDARIYPDSQAIVAHVAIAVPLAAVSGSTLAIDLLAGSWGPQPYPLDIRRVTDGQGRSLEAFLSSDHRRLEAPLSRLRDSGGATATLVVDYRTPLDSVVHQQLGYQIFTGADGHDWYPQVEGLSESYDRFFDFDVTLETPIGLPILTSGAPADSARRRGRTRVRYTATHVEGFAVAFQPGFRTIAVERGGITVTALVPDSLLTPFTLVTEEAAEAAAAYRRMYGFFPLSRIGIVPGYARASGGYPLPNVFMVHLANLTRPFIRAITAHELGHYYWGLWTLGDIGRLDWVMLANGIWADQYQLAQRESTSVVQQWRRSPLEWFLGFFTAQVGNYDQRLGITGPALDSMEYDYNTYVRHCKSATGLYLVSRRLGWERYLELQRRLLEAYRDRPLPADTLVAWIARAGYPDAQRFFAVWTRDDARLGYQVARVTNDSSTPNAVWVLLEKTGTVSYPVDVAVRAASGTERRVTFTGERDVDSMLVRLDAPFAAVTVDPDGELPMWNSDGPEIRRLYIEALDDAGQGAAFEGLARQFLAERSDPELRARLVRRRFAVGDYEDAVAVAGATGDTLACVSRITCRSTVLEARALASLGMAERARMLLESIRAAAAENGAGRQWLQAKSEVDKPRRP